MTSSEGAESDSAVDLVRRQLADQITSGALRPGDRLGAERDLAADLGVSRATLRTALAQLADSGLVRRTPGRGGGTFVSGKLMRDLSKVVGVPAMLREQGFTSGSRVVATSVRSADQNVEHGLGLKPGELVVEVVRVRLADAIPISLERACFPAARFPGLLERPLGGSLYALLAAEYDTMAGSCRERIEAVEADHEVAELLDISPGAPLLAVTRTTCDAHGVAFEFGFDLFRGDRTAVTVDTLPGGTTTRTVFPPTDQTA